MTYSEAIEIMRYVQKRTHRPVLLTQAMHLAQYSFPLDKKFDVIDQVVLLATLQKREIWSLYYFREAFIREESDYHKGKPPKHGEMMKVSDILGMKQ